MGEYFERRKLNRKKEYHYKQLRETNSLKRRINSIKKLVASNKLSKALSETNIILEEYPGNSFALFQHANILYLLGEVDEAKKEFEYIISNDLESKHSSLYKLGVIAISEDEFDKAYDYFKMNIETSPYEEIFSIVELSRLELDRGNTDAAYEILLKYSDMKNPHILLQEAVVLRKQRRLQDAYEVLTSNIFSDNKDAVEDYYLIKGSIEIDLKKYDEAKKSLEKVVAGVRTKKYYRAKTELAYLNYQLLNYDEAISICEDVIANSTGKYIGKTMIILGNVYKCLLRFDEAEICYLKSLDYGYYSDKKGYLCLGNLKLVEKKYDEAKSYYKKYLNAALAPKSKSVANLKLALVSSKQNDVSSTIEYLAQVDESHLESINLEDYKCIKVDIDKIEGLELSFVCYSNLQHYDYSIDALINHIDKVHTNNEYSAVFNTETDLEELVCQIPQLLSRAQIVDNRYYEIYQVEYPSIGYVNGELTNTLQMVVFPESTKVLTMYPVVDRIDVKDMSKNQKQKTKSQIEKFNQRYRIDK